MNIQQLNLGFQPDVIVPEDYVLGGFQVPTDMLEPQGQWDRWLPEKEVQKRNIETFNCTAFATTNQIEIYEARKFNTNVNYSDRYLGSLAGTYPPGNSPHRVLETVRKISGLIEEEELPFGGETAHEYYRVNIPSESLNKGKKWLSKRVFRHEWVFDQKNVLPEKRHKIMEALMYSPVAVSVFAWAQDDNGLYIKPEGTQDTHWTLCYGYEEGKYWKIYDSYPDSDGVVKKKVAWDTDFMLAKRIYIDKKLSSNFWTKWFSWI